MILKRIKKLCAVFGTFFISLSVVLLGVLDMLKTVDLSQLLPASIAGKTLAILGLLGIVLEIMVKGSGFLKITNKPDEGF